MSSLKLKRVEGGSISSCGRFLFVRDDVAGYRNGCWKTAWHLLDNGKLASDSFEETLRDCKDIARDILNPE